MNRSALALFALIAAGLCACATPASVVVSRSYDPARVQRVTLASFADFPNVPGSGAIGADTFEKYLLLAGYRLVERRQAAQILAEHRFTLSGGADASRLSAAGKLLGVDAIAIGSVTDYTGPRDQTVMVDMPQEQTDPIYGQIETTKRSGDTRIHTVQNVVTGYQTTMTSQIVPTTQTVPAHAAVNVRLVDVNDGEVLWSASASANGEDLPAALEEASANAMRAVAKKLKAAAKK